MTAAKVGTIPRRPIKLAFGFPPSAREHEAIFELGRVQARAQLYEGGEPQALACKALGPATDAQKVGDRIVVVCEWRGVDEPPAEWMAIVGYEQQPLKRRALQYDGMGRRSA